MKIPFIANILKRSKKKGPTCALAFGFDGVHFARVKYIAGRPQLESYVYQAEPGLGKSGIGAAALEKKSKELQLGSYACMTLLAPGEYQLLQVDAPNVPVEEMKAAIRWSIKDMLTYHVDDAILDVLHIPSQEGGMDRKKLMYVVVASSDLVKKRTELFEQAHLGLGVIDIPEMAQRNIAKLYEQEGRALALLAFDESGCLLTFTSHGELYMARRIEISPGQLQDANDTLRDQYRDRLALELQRSIDHFDRQFKHLPVQRLLISAPDQAGLVELLSNNLDLPVVRLDLSEEIDLGSIPETIGAEAMVFALHTIGAALRQEE